MNVAIEKQAGAQIAGVNAGAGQAIGGYQRGATEARAGADQNYRLEVGANKQTYVSQVDAAGQIRNAGIEAAKLRQAAAVILDVPRGTAINPLTGRNRTPTTYNLDLGAYYPIKLSENRQLRIQLDWFNVFNNQPAIRQDETLRINSGIPGAASIQFPNPFYGQGTAFQYPSSLRLGIKFQF